MISTQRRVRTKRVRTGSPAEQNCTQQSHTLNHKSVFYTIITFLIRLTTKDSSLFFSSSVTPGKHASSRMFTIAARSSRASFASCCDQQDTDQFFTLDTSAIRTAVLAFGGKPSHVESQAIIFRLLRAPVIYGTTAMQHCNQGPGRANANTK